MDLVTEVNALLDWAEIADARAQAQQLVDEEFRRRMRDKYGITQTMAPDDGEDE